MRYLHRIDPFITADQARLVIDGARHDLPRLRPKMRRLLEARIADMESDLAEIEAKESNVA